MKTSMKAWLISLALTLFLSVGGSYAQIQTPIDELVSRIVPGYAGKISFETIPAEKGADVFELESHGAKLIIRGNNYNSMATGLNHYLKYYCHSFVSWYKDDAVIYPSSMPLVPKKVRKTARVEKRFFLNYCTFSYTMPWWKWQDWERLIDWMALNGINMPLAITGQEAIWLKVWKQYGFREDEIRSYFTGPAFLSWHRMANIDHWEGPLPMSWIEEQFELQKRIVGRERELGMTPVLPAFAGHVPEIIKTKFPKARIKSLGPWGGFSEEYHTYFLNPFDPLFSEIQGRFLAEQKKAFGTDHIYGIDPFNEVEPPSWEPDYLAKASQAIYSSVVKVDKQANWLQMSWMFYIDRKKWTDERIKAFVAAIPQGKMTLLDYYCEDTEVWKFTEKHYGQPYLWCYLGNFGGNTMLAGNLAEVDARLENALKNGGTNLQGIGSTLEGFDVNPLMYDFIFEKAWTNGPISIADWIDHWASMRGGLNDTGVKTAWRLLSEKVYTSPATLGQATLTNAKPYLSAEPHWTTNPATSYSNKDLLHIWELLLSSQDKQNEFWKYDVTNVGRQVLGNYFANLYHDFRKQYDQRNLAGMKASAGRMLSLLSDLDTLLAGHHSFSLAKWISEARDLGHNPEEKDFYERNARTLITTWGGETRSLNDYANRSWNGLTSGFYRERWKIFTEDVINAVQSGASADEKLLRDKINAFEDKWVGLHDAPPVAGQTNPGQISQSFFEKYKQAILNHD